MPIRYTDFIDNGFDLHDDLLNDIAKPLFMPNDLTLDKLHILSKGSIVFRDLLNGPIFTSEQLMYLPDLANAIHQLQQYPYIEYKYSVSADKSGHELLTHLCHVYEHGSAIFQQMIKKGQSAFDAAMKQYSTLCHDLKINGITTTQITARHQTIDSIVLNGIMFFNRRDCSENLSLYINLDSMIKRIIEEHRPVYIYYISHVPNTPYLHVEIHTSHNTKAIPTPVFVNLHTGKQITKRTYDTYKSRS